MRLDNPQRRRALHNALLVPLASGTIGSLATLTSYGAQAQGSGEWRKLPAARQLVGTATPLTQGLVLELPLLSEDGASVTLSVKTDNRLRISGHIQSLHLFATRNPSPEIARYDLAPEFGAIDLTTRVRLNESQSVIAVARTSANEVLIAEREIRITTSGCMARMTDADASGEMQTRVRLPGPLRAGVSGDVLTLINHPMHTGLATDASGKTPAQRIIKTFEVRLDNAPLLTAQYFRSLAANPYLRFAIRPRKTATIAMRWVEDTGKTAQYSGRIVVS